MVSLQAASAARTEHELGRHDYHHVQLVTEPSRAFQTAAPRRDPKAG